MRVKVEVFWLPKAGNTNDEYEDAFGPQGPLDKDFSSLNLAVADGATETSFSALWADLLVNAFVSDDLRGPKFVEDVEPIQECWKQQLGDKKLPWYAEEKLRSGAFSTLAGLRLQSEGTWSALALGDSCIFQVRQDDLIVRFPIEYADQFDSRPVLVPSNHYGTAEIEAHVRRKDGDWKVGDIFYLMTDAIACYLLRRWEIRADDPYVLRLFDDIGDADKFADFVKRERSEVLPDGRLLLRNDDITAIRCLMIG